MESVVLTLTERTISQIRLVCFGRSSAPATKKRSTLKTRKNADKRWSEKTQHSVAVTFTTQCSAVPPIHHHRRLHRSQQPPHRRAIRAWPYLVPEENGECDGE